MTAIAPATDGTALLDREKRGMQQSTGKDAARPLPEYLTASEIGVMLDCAPHAELRLLMLIQWRSGLRISEALALTWADIQPDDDNPTVRVRQGKGKRPRMVPLHPELRSALGLVAGYQRPRLHERVVAYDRSTAFRWTKAALQRAVERGQLTEGRDVGTHTFRHSYARQLLMHGIPINHLGKWLGQAHIDHTLVYLKLLPDPAGSLATVP
ncbi:MAG: site-specific integrase [Chloroflexi bacterium]|nr:site-specific integrase [Chloroflexota bacterium]